MSMRPNVLNHAMYLIRIMTNKRVIRIHEIFLLLPLVREIMAMTRKGDRLQIKFPAWATNLLTGCGVNRSNKMRK